MSELEKREDLSRFDSMSTEELQEILRKHTHGELETEPDTQDLFEIMEVLSKRRQQQKPQAFRSDADAFVEFRKHYMPKESKPITQYKAPKLPSRLLRTIAAVLAIVLVLTAGTTITAKALNYDIWRKFASWTTEIFQFKDISKNNDSTPDKTFSVEYDQLREEFDKNNIDEGIIPGWLPDGYTHKSIMVMESPKERSIYAIYENNNAELIISIRQTIGAQMEQIEKNDDLLEVYVADGVEYYIFSNTENLQATWSIGEFQCIIGGNIALEEMKKMIDSINQ